MTISDELRKLIDPNGECCCEYCLSNKCKEWAYVMGYTMSSGTTMLSSAKKYNCLCEPIEDTLDYTEQYAKTEPEAIFRAGQYILDNLSNK